MNMPGQHLSTEHPLISRKRGGGRASTRLRSGAHAAMLSIAVSVGLLSGCTAMVGRPTSPLTAKRDEPGVMLCMSERVSGGGIRIVGQLNPGIYPITGASIEYRSAGPSDAVPATSETGGKGLVLTGAHSEKVEYRKGAKTVTFTIGADAARNLRDKVLWYRWTIGYDRNGSPASEVSEIHRTSLEEAGLPRDAWNPGPDSSVALPSARRR